MHVINGGLSLTVPDASETNWYAQLEAIWTAISAHNHDLASNKGAAIGALALAANGVTDASIRLRNNQYLRARNAADSADQNLVRLNASNQPEYIGSTTNDTPVAGVIGEVLGPITRVRSAATPINPTGTTVNVCTTTSITLTPGDWWVSGVVGFDPAATTNITDLKAAVSKTTGTLPATDTTAVPTAGEYTAQIASAAYVPVNDIVIPIPAFRVSVSTNTPIFLVAQATFTVSTIACYGSLFARRAR